MPVECLDQQYFIFTDEKIEAWDLELNLLAGVVRFSLALPFVSLNHYKKSQK